MEDQGVWPALASADAKSIKYADTINYTSSIAEHDPKFAKVYLPDDGAVTPSCL